MTRTTAAPRVETRRLGEDPDDLFSDKRTASRYDRTAVTIARWVRDPRIKFPPPDVYINGRGFRKRKTLDAFDERMAREGQRNNQAPPTRRAS